MREEERRGKRKGGDESPIIFFLGKSRLHFSGAANCSPPRTGLVFLNRQFQTILFCLPFCQGIHATRVLVRVKFLWSGKTSTRPRVRDTATVGKRGREGRKVNHLLASLGFWPGEERGRRRRRSLMQSFSLFSHIADGGGGGGKKLYYQGGNK